MQTVIIKGNLGYHLTLAMLVFLVERGFHVSATIDQDGKNQEIVAMFKGACSETIH